MFERIVERAFPSLGASAPVIGFSVAMAGTDQAIKEFLRPRMYRHSRIMRTMRIMQDAEVIFDVRSCLEA